MKILGMTEEQKLRLANFHNFNKTSKCSFKIWKEIFFVDYKPNLAEIVVNEVVGDRMIKITLLGLFNIAEQLDEFADYLRHTLMLQVYTGQSQHERLKWLIKFNFEHGSEKTKQIIINESLA